MTWASEAERMKKTAFGYHCGHTPRPHKAATMVFVSPRLRGTSGANADHVRSAGQDRSYAAPAPCAGAL